MFSQRKHQFWINLERILFCEYFILASSTTLYLFPCLSYFPTAVCVFASPRHLLHLYPFPSLTTSHLLDLIEFFPEEEMFPPNESVEILHSDKHDPIFRLIKESLSLSLSSLLSSHLFVAAHRPFLALPFFVPRFSTIP